MRGAEVWRRFPEDPGVQRYHFVMRTLVACICLFGCVALGQTVIDSRQSVAGPVIQESKWCPGPIFTVTGPKTLTVGANWTPAKPCIARFNVTPIQVTDPVILAKFTSPVVVTLAAAATIDDLYFWITSPAPPGTPGIVVGQRSTATVATCSGCAIVTQSMTPRQFPAMVMPIGFIPVMNGALFEQGYDMMSSQQFSLAQGVVAIVRRDQDGYTVRLESAGAGTPAASALTSASISSLQSESLRNRATLAQLDTFTRGTKLADLERQVNTLSQQVNDLKTQAPPTTKELAEAKDVLLRTYTEMQPQVESLMQNFREREMITADRVESIRFEAMQQIEGQTQAYFESSHVAAPKDLAAACVNRQYAFDGKYKYECVNDHWVRFKVEAPKPKTQVRGKTPEKNSQIAQRTR